MKLYSSRFTLAIALGSAATFAACGGDDEKPAKSEPTEDGGSGSGGSASSGGASSGGAAAGGSAAGGASEDDAGAGGSLTGGAGGAGGATGSGGVPAAGGAGAGGAAGGASPCDSPLRCLPAYPPVPHPVANPFDASNAAHRAKATLGKILFWEEQIGELGTVACGTCHRGAAGGSDPRAALPESLKPGTLASTDDDVRGSMGVPVCQGAADGGVPVIPNPSVIQVTGRKAPTYLDAMFGLEIFWDGRAGFCKNGEAIGGCFYDPDLDPAAPPIIMAATDPVTSATAGGALEAQAVGPPLSDVEMACARQTWADVHGVLRTARPLVLASAVPNDMRDFILLHQTYPAMFEAAFGAEAKLNVGDPDNVINTRRIAFALATHERNLTSNQTPWDRWNDGDDSALTARQVQGFELFMGKAKCNTCHAPPLFTNNGFHYIGFHDPAWDPGRQAISGRAFEVGMMKTPTLRNAGAREAGGLLRSGAGPGASLATVMSLYNTGGAFRGDTAIAPLIDGSIAPLNLTQLEIDAVIDFVRNGLTDARARNETPPFDRPTLGSED